MTWPTAPFYIPYSPGMPNWWDLVWWVFQLGVMALLLWFLSNVALRVDRDFVRLRGDEQHDEYDDEE